MTRVALSDLEATLAKAKLPTFKEIIGKTFCASIKDGVNSRIVIGKIGSLNFTGDDWLRINATGPLAVQGYPLTSFLFQPTSEDENYPAGWYAEFEGGIESPGDLRAELQLLD